MVHAVQTMATSFATLTAPYTAEHAARNTDGVEAHQPTADQDVYLAVLLHPLHHRAHHQSKSMLLLHPRSLPLLWLPQHLLVLMDVAAPHSTMRRVMPPVPMVVAALNMGTVVTAILTAWSLTDASLVAQLLRLQLL